MRSMIVIAGLAGMLGGVSFAQPPGKHFQIVIENTKPASRRFRSSPMSQDDFPSTCTAATDVISTLPRWRCNRGKMRPSQQISRVSACYTT